MRIPPKPAFYILLKCTATGVGLILFLALWSFIFRPEIKSSPEAVSPEIKEHYEALRHPQVNPDDQPVIWQDVDYSEGKSAAWYPKGEAPVLAELVAEGKLPPVEERIGPEPLVLKGIAGIGNYGGTWFRVATSDSNADAINRRMSSSYLYRYSPNGFPTVPHIARSHEVNADKTEWTFHIRKGIRWSDGQPFTTDDILYRWTRDLTATGEQPGQAMRAMGQTGRVEKIDDYTIKYIFPVPNPLFLEKISRSISAEHYLPRHYFEPYHPEDGDPGLIESAMKARGYSDPTSFYKFLKQDWKNPAYPRMWPWVIHTYTLNPPYIFDRNPYYYAVDTEGNQLPYVDRVFCDIRALEAVPATAASGNLTMQAFNIRFRDYTLLMSSRESGDYEVYHWLPFENSVWTIYPNLNRTTKDGNPVSPLKHELLNEARFRQALSLAINRQQIIDAVYYGIGTPSQVNPKMGTLFHSEKSAIAYTEYDPQRANRLLDQLGLVNRDLEGFRTFKNGTRMTWFLEMGNLTDPSPAQFVVDDWAAVGIRARQRIRSNRLYIRTSNARKADFEVMTSQDHDLPLLAPRNVVPGNGYSRFAIAYSRWYKNGGMAGNPDATLYGGEAPPPGHPLVKALRIFEEAAVSANLEDMQATFEEAMQIAAENVWTISIATAPPQLAVVKNGFKGVPQKAVYTDRAPAQMGPETFYFENPYDTPETIAELKRDIIGTTPHSDYFESGTLPSHEKQGRSILPRHLFIIALLCGLVFLGFRYPYIGKRLIIMIPTLFIISAISFVIIQAPPGNYLETRILDMEMQGALVSEAEIEQLETLFYLNDPVWVQYARWLGLYWFVTFESADFGLLQGHMGRSMEDNQFVNDIVGDRILLTFFISLGTILLTWVIALPIGIYSAVRQYSLGDYIFTLFGFIGMCIPNFLLALILMYWANRFFGVDMGGLFSPEYAAQAEWNSAKIVDFLKHVWLPVVVLGISGTAGMIRVMRANLLEELNKPYVVTARAKGVRPLKLLIKYPIRLALNPFISGIGGIFPQLVSGGAIVAIVLSLPTVGPLMLNALTSEDMYLAGSMLMVLSFLSIIGTLVSDLLLMALDPRIRMEGKTR